MLNNYGNELRQLYEHNGNLDDLEKAVEIQLVAANSDINSTEDSALFLYNLSLSLIKRYEVTQNTNDLELAIQNLEESVNLSAKKSQELVPRQFALADALRRIFQINNNLSDLDRAIKILNSLEGFIHRTSNYRTKIKANLVIAYQLHHVATGRLTDLEKAIQSQRQVVELVSEDTPEYPYYLANLSILLAQLYSYIHEIGLLHESKQGFLDAIDIAREDSVFTSRCNHNLANTLSIIFKETGDGQYLEQSIEYRQAAIDSTPEESLELAARIASFAKDKLSIYEIDKDPTQLSIAIDQLRKAVDLQSTSELEHAGILFTYSEALARMYDINNMDDFLQEGIKAIERATEIAYNMGSPDLLKFGRTWGHWASSRGSWSEAAHAFSYALDAADTLIEIQIMPVQKSYWIKDFQNLHNYAAYAFAKNDDFRSSALALERGRARFLSERINLSGQEIESLASHDPILAIEMMKTANRLLDLYSKINDLASTMFDSSIQNEILAAKEKWDYLKQQANSINGFERFANPPIFEDILCAASTRTLVYIVMTYWEGFALIIEEDGNVHALFLPKLTEVTLHKKLENLKNQFMQDNDFPAAVDSLCNWLWDTIMEHICTFFSENGIGRVSLIPHGMLGVLPLHAAWTNDETRPARRIYALDCALISYTPSARALLFVNSSCNLPLNSVVVIEDPTSTLFYAVEESVSVLSNFSSRNLIGGEAATKEIVIKLISQFNIVHFCCHGYSDPDEPLNTGLIMANNSILSVKNVQGLNMDNTRLVVLSACETGLIGTELKDEAIGFPTTFMTLRVPGIISTFWSINDKSTSLLMEVLYENLIGRGLEPDEALRNAQITIRDGQIQSADYSHPYYWAAFFMTGL